MKLSCALLALCAASAPPRIELQLDESLTLRKTAALTPTTKFQPGGTRVMSRKDYTIVCSAGDDSTKCPLPKAKAYDSKDGEVVVQRKIFLVDSDGVKQNKVVAKVDRTKRSTYIIKFDASDDAGNHAEQVTIALVLDDTTKPILRHNGCRSRIVEAKTAFAMCKKVTSKDNIDGDITNRIRYTIIRDKSETIASNVVLSKATSLMNSNQIGDYRIIATVDDKAGIYGANAKNNLKKYGWTVTVRDTTVPVVSVTGANPHTTECAKSYSDFGATATDTYDSSVKVTVNNGVDVTKIGKYAVNYNAADAAGNAAVEKVRTVVVSDTKAPKISLKGASAVEINAGSDTPIDAGAKCRDSCDGKLSVNSGWTKQFNNANIGTYTYKHSCTDKSGNSASITRTYTVVDRTAPIITVVGKDKLTLEAHPTKKYKDQGALCHDYVNGNLNSSVKTRGNGKKRGVNLAVPGTYKIYYDCKDMSGNKGTPLMRTVVVQDTTCPVVTIKGASLLSIEAGFPYSDAGATAADNLDGDITKKIRTVNAVDTAKAFLAKRSCAEIKAADAKALSGNYFITASNFKRMRVFCEMKTGKTWYKCKNCKKATPASGKGGSCAARGLVMSKWVSAAAKAQFGAAYATVKENTNTYLCTTTKAKFDISNKVKHSEIAHAEAGKYIVTYAVKDAAGNKQCKQGRRTVIVSDTLPPVITLKLNGKQIHMSGKKNAANPAFDAKVNPFLASGLMEEQSTSVNGWIIGAVASAVTGVALLGFASKRSTVVSVPV